MFTVSYTENGVRKRFAVPSGETLIGRAPGCDLVLNGANVSRQHARLCARGEKLYVRDLGSRFGTFKGAARLVEETEVEDGDTLVFGDLKVVVEDGRRGGTQSVSLDEDHLIVTKAAILRPVDDREQLTGAAPAPAVEAARLMTLLSEIGQTLVGVRSLPQVLSKIVDLTFDTIPAERALLLLRNRAGTLHPEIARTRSGEQLVGARISRTVVDQVLRDRVAMLASDTAVDPRLAAAASIHALSVRSFMCAPLWNRNDVIGVIYVDNPASKRFTAADLDVFTALSNYVAVAIEQARLADELLEETRRRERLQRYHSPSVVNRILSAESANADVVAQARDVSIMFADIVEFTPLSERLAPGEIVSLLGSFFEVATDVIFEYDGTLDKFIGDCVMAVFGAPFDQHDHARRAIETAQAIRRALVPFNETIAPLTLRLRTAINSGEAMVGDVGSPKRREFTVLGDVVNVASRLERMCEPGRILVSRATLDRAGMSYPVRSLGAVPLRGHSAEIEVFELLD